MTKTLSSKPAISINIRDSLILIHKNTLRILGKPEYIQILVNPADKSIVLCCSSKSDHLAHPVKPEIFVDNKKTLRLHSYPLLQSLQRIYPKWSDKETYKIVGNFISHLNIVKFSMSDSFLSTRCERGEYDE